MKDGTAASQRPAHPVDGISAADLKRGYTEIDTERIPVFSPDTTGEKQVGDPYTYGGFLGRPQGTAR